MRNANTDRNGDCNTNGNGNSNCDTDRNGNADRNANGNPILHTRWSNNVCGYGRRSHS